MNPAFRSLKIYTNGAIKPVDVLHYSTSVLRTQLEHFLVAEEIPFNEITETSNGGELSSTEFKEVGVSLEVGASLTEDNLIGWHFDWENRY